MARVYDSDNKEGGMYALEVYESHEGLVLEVISTSSPQGLVLEVISTSSPRMGVLLTADEVSSLVAELTEWLLQGGKEGKARTRFPEFGGGLCVLRASYALSSGLYALQVYEAGDEELILEVGYMVSPHPHSMGVLLTIDEVSSLVTEMEAWLQGS
jgi:hypothetical protein